jgi:beta-alanine--pyruvate transaminase
LRSIRVFEKALDEGFMVRFSADILAIAPPFVSTPAEIESMIEGIRRALRAVPV